MGKKTTKTVKVPESMAEEWDTYVEENPEVDSVSHLIRLSVQYKITEDYELGSRRKTTEGAQESESTGVSSEVLSILRSIKSDVGHIDERLTILEKAESVKSSYDVMRDAYDALPTPPKSEIVPDGEGTGSHLYEDTDYQEWAITPREIAREQGYDEAEVRDALESLADTTGEVKRLSRDTGTFDIGDSEPEDYYFKRGR